MVQIKIFECIYGPDATEYQAMVSFTKFVYINHIITNIFYFKVLLIAAYTI